MRIPINLNDYHEPTTAPIGKYELIIASAEEVETKQAKKPQFRISLGFVGHPEYQNLTNYVGIPGEKDEPNAMAFKALLMKRFLALFKIPVPTNGIDTEQLAMQMIGATATAEVAIENEKDESGNDKPDGRQFNRLLVPRLREEAIVGGHRAPPPPSQKR